METLDKNQTRGQIADTSFSSPVGSTFMLHFMAGFHCQYWRSFHTRPKDLNIGSAIKNKLLK